MREACFTGVLLHGAHGYLESLFLSPLSNRLPDHWEGSLESRSRFVLEVLAAVRSAVGPDSPVALKLNSSDFQKGGFTNAECIELVKKLKDSSLDLLVVSGGSLEHPKIAGLALKHEGEDAPRESTVAVFESLERGELDVIGLCRPIITNPEVPQRIVSGENDRAPSPEAALHPFHLLP